MAPRVVPNLDPVTTVHGHPSQDQRPNTVLQTCASASSVPNARANSTVHDTGSCVSSTSAPRLKSLSHRPPFYASSAPSSSVNLHPENYQRSRPPVPLFNSNPGDMNLQTLSHSAQPFLKGRIVASTSVTFSPLTRSEPDLSADWLDFPSNYQDTAFDLSSVASFDNLGNFDLQASTASFSPVNQRMTVSVSTSMHTVSPKDLELDTMSAPPSTSITNLTTPGTNYMDSPYVIESSDTSPIFGNEQLGAEAEYWPSLFGNEEPKFEPVKVETKSPTTTTHVAPNMSRHGSSGQHSSKSSHRGSHSSANGVSAKRRDKPLPVITIDDPTDIVAVKRARNTMAARKSRQKRMERTEELLNQVAELEKKVDHWRQIAMDHGYVEPLGHLAGQTE